MKLLKIDGQPIKCLKKRHFKRKNKPVTQEGNKDTTLPTPSEAAMLTDSITC